MTELKNKNMETIKEQYQYKMIENEKLIIDKPSKPLIKKAKKDNGDVKIESVAKMEIKKEEDKNDKKSK